VKRIVAFMVLALMMVAVGVNAQTIPSVIYGKAVNVGEVGGIKVTLKNIRTDTSVSMYTDKTGYFQFTPANMPFGFQNGDNFELSAKDVKNQINNLNAGDIRESNLNLLGNDCPSCPDCPSCDCPDCPTCYDCPIPDECEVCTDCPEPQECPEPEPTDESHLLDVILSGLAGAGVCGAAVTLTLGKTAQHFHRGIKNKHSIFTRHLDAEIRHKIGEYNPTYKKIGDKWVYVPKEE